ncbi:MAG: hypothetical protein AB8I08_02865 [Sandaracinaceae bacterium]
MENKVGFTVALPDPVTGQPVQTHFYGTVQQLGGQADPHAPNRVHQALSRGVAEVLVGALRAHQVAMPTLNQSMAHFTPAIVQQANAQLGGAGIQLTSVTLHASVPESATAPAAAAIAAAPSPMESVASSFAANVAPSAPSQVNVNVGGFKVGVGAEGVNGDSLADQAADKVKGQILHYAILGGVLLFVCFICCGSVAFKLLFS